MFSVITAFAENAATGSAAAGNAAAGAAEPGMLSMASPLLMLVLMFAVFYFILIRPQKKKEKELLPLIQLSP